MQNTAAPEKTIDDLVTLSFDDQHKFELTRQRPIGVFSGPTGSGKMEALKSAVLPFLAGGGYVLSVTHYRDTSDALLDYVQTNTRTHCGHYATYVMELDDYDTYVMELDNQEVRPTLAQVLERFTPPEGALVIVEDPQALKDMNTSTLFTTCDRLNVAMLLVLQDTAIFNDFNESRTAFIARMTGQQSITVVGTGGVGETVIELGHDCAAASVAGKRSLFSLAMGSKWVWAFFVCEALLMYGNGNATLVLFAWLFAVGAGNLPWRFQFAADSYFVKFVMSKKGRWGICTVAGISALLTFTGTDQKRLIALFFVTLFLLIPFKVIRRSSAR